MRMTTIVAVAGVLASAGCATPLADVRTVQAGDARLSCEQLEREIGQMDSLIAQAERSDTAGRLLGGAAQIGVGILQDRMLGGANDFASYAAGAGAMNVLQGTVSALTGNAQMKSRRAQEQARERKALLTRFYYAKCAQ